MSLLSSHGCAGSDAGAPITKNCSAVELDLAEIPKVDHRVSQNLKCVMQLAQSFEPQQQTPELILPSEYALDGVEPLFENGGVEDRLAAPLGGFSAAWIRVDVRNHAAIENRFAIYPAIVDAIQADNCSLKIKTDSIRDARHKRQGFA